MTIEALFQLEDTARARTSDPDTSHEAADAASASVWASQRTAIDLLQLWDKPMTALQLEDIAEARGFNRSRARMRSTLPELEEKGIVERVGRTTPERGRGRILWALVGRADA